MFGLNTKFSAMGNFWHKVFPISKCILNRKWGMNQIKNTIILLRFPFSIFLLPITLFSLVLIQPEINYQLFLVLAIWHLLVFPSCNGYNSYHDWDEGAIGGLASPPQPSRLLLYFSNFMDATAILLSLFLNNIYALFVTGFIIASRLYSNRNVRFKKFPIVGFLVVFLFQGAWVFYSNFFALSPAKDFLNPHLIFSGIASSFFIATIYPLTQIYQHEADGKDGVKTLSMLLGIKGTFIFAAFMFSLSTLFIYLVFYKNDATHVFWLFNIIMFPSTLYFLFWAIRSFKNPVHVNFKNTMVMLVLSSCLNNLFFLILLFK
jgi:1,4-dihydroxy-2-naphthoate octaprenyltransferase